ncbi:MAG: hypothetical protein VR72_09085 [Clostridiaceae bacterium BRH_c20a]|nr:MAG: hypothetical protein VR72_09085 [Clostridiaceae bacterium BRH_c20a]
MFSTICLKIAHYLSRNTKEEDQEEVIAFGLELIFSELSKLIILLAAGHILNILIEVIVITLVFSIYRMLSGGIHLDTFWACLLATLASIIFLALLVEPVALGITVKMVGFLILITYIFNVLLVILRVPVGNKNHTITSIEKIKFYKKASFFLITFLTLISLISLIFINAYQIKVLIISAFFGMSLQAITLLPITCKIIGVFENKLN